MKIKMKGQKKNTEHTNTIHRKTHLDTQVKWSKNPKLCRVQNTYTFTKIFEIGLQMIDSHRVHLKGSILIHVLYTE